ncbi:hypothetical protein OAS86_02290 [Gammaproteobacteria bacterium]|nr:hypothetical protein [Gammaproteobacteria bacterium]
MNFKACITFCTMDKTMKTLSIIIVSGLISACTSNGVDPNVFNAKNVGKAFGGVAGAVGCAELFDGQGSRAGWTAACALLGSEIGQGIGVMMTQENQQALETAPTGQTQRWTNPDGIVSMTPTKTYITNNGPCREFRSEIEIDGQQNIATGTACRQPTGEWRISSAN